MIMMMDDDVARVDGDEDDDDNEDDDEGEDEDDANEEEESHTDKRNHFYEGDVDDEVDDDFTRNIYISFYTAP